MNVLKSNQSNKFKGSENPLVKSFTTIPLERNWAGVSKAFEAMQSITHRDIALLVKHKDTKVDELTGYPASEQGFVRDILSIVCKGFISASHGEKTVGEFSYEIATALLLSDPLYNKEPLDVIIDNALKDIKELYDMREKEKKNKDTHEEDSEEDSEKEPKEDGKEEPKEEHKEEHNVFYISFGKDWTPIQNAKVLRGAKISAARLSNGLLNKKEVRVAVQLSSNPTVLEVQGHRKDGEDKWEETFEKEIITI